SPTIRRPGFPSSRSAGRDAPDYPRDMDQQPTVVDVPAIAKELGARFADAGHELYLVGGSVRDLILGRPTIDLDFCTSAHPTQTTKVLQGWADRRYLMGVAFG